MSAPSTPSTINFVQAQPFVLSGSGASIGDTTLLLQSFTGIDGTNIVTADLGSFAYGTIEPGNGSQEEAILFTGVTQNANGTATLTGVSSLAFKQPYTLTSGIQKTHAGASKFIMSNDAAFYNNLVLYMNSIAGAGAANASTTVKGIAQAATLAQVNAGTPTGSTAAVLFVTPDTLASSTFGTANLPSSGTIISTIASSAPTGYLLTNGAAVSRSTYANLFTYASGTYGAGDGSTTFNLPYARPRLSSALAINSADFGSSNTNKYLNYTGSNMGITATSKYTISFWTKLDTEISSGAYGFLQIGDTGTQSQQIIDYSYNSGSRTINYIRNRAGGTEDSLSSPTIALGTSTWHNIVVTYDAVTMSLYLDGNLQGTTTSSTSSGSSGATQGIQIGQAARYAVFASAKITNVKIFNFPWTSAQVVNEYLYPTTLTGSEANLLAYYSFGTNLTTDLGPNGYTLTNNNSVATSTDYPSNTIGPIINSATYNLYKLIKT